MSFIGDNFINKICRDSINQIFEILIENEKKLEIKQKLIDPLIDYYKNKLFLFYGIITLLLIIVIISNIYIIYRMSQFVNII